MKRILIVTDDKIMGGVSILLEDILNNISSNINIDLLILNNRGNCFKNLGNNVHIIYGTKFFDIVGLHLKDLIYGGQIFKVIKKLYLIFLMKTNFIKYKIKRERKKIGVYNYDIEISFKDSFTSVFTGFGDSKEKIQWLHSDYSKVDYLKNYQKLFFKIFPNFQKFVAVSKPVRDSFASVYGQKEKICIISNLIDTDKIKAKALEEGNLSDKKINIVSVGRLHVDKRYDELIKIVSKLKDAKLFEDAHLTIIGEGAERAKLENLIETFNLSGEVTLLGNKPNPYCYLKNAKLFVLPSRHESFGNVVIEALVLKVPVVSTRVANIDNMLDKKYGIVVDDIPSLYDTLAYLLTHTNQITKMHKNLNNYTYNNQEIIEQIEDLLK